MNKKVTKVFSWTLMKQSIRSNLALTIVVILMMCMMSVVITFASNMIGGEAEEEDISEAQTDFYTYLFALASYDEMTGADLSYEDFAEGDNTEMYETVFNMLSAQADMDLSTEGFAEAADILSRSDVGLDEYISEFEYVYALSAAEGIFSGDTLDINTLMVNMLDTMGLNSDLVENLSEMDSSAMLNQMYYTVMLILPILLLIIFAGDSLVVNQVDKGSMAYVLSTPIKRRAVTITQMVYMIVIPFIAVAITCCVRMAAMNVFAGSVDVPQTLAMYGGMYVLVEAMGSICYFASCFFNLTRYALAFGGGLNIWFFLASLLGMFGSDSMVQMGMGSEALGTFNNLTLVGLFDIDALSTVGSGAVDTSFVWKLAVLAVIAAGMYIAGIIRFRRKDLPL